MNRGTGTRRRRTNTYSVATKDRMMRAKKDDDSESDPRRAVHLRGGREEGRLGDRSAYL